MSSRPLHDGASAPAAAAMSAFHANIVAEVSAAVGSDTLVVVGMAQNPVVKRVRKALEGAKIQYRYLEYGSYFSQWKQRLAIKMWSGWPTFPQVFVQGKLIGGDKETQEALVSGELQTWMDQGRSA